MSSGFIHLEASSDESEDEEEDESEGELRSR
jgi:hypothetical protein